MNFLSLVLFVICINAAYSTINLKKEYRSKENVTKTSKKNKLSTLSTLCMISGGSSGSDEVSKLDWRYFAAGGICAATSHGITTPIDVVKTKIQTNPEKYKKGMISAARDIIKEEGVGFLLAGLGPTVVGYGIEGALKFGFYESFKKLFLHLTPSQFVNFLMASVIAGAVASIVLCPMEETRIKMVGEPSWGKENLLTGLLRLIKETGVFATFGGLPAMLSKQIPYTMGKQVSFDIFANFFYKVASAAGFKTTQKEIKVLISFLSSASASVIACISSQPGDMILTATYKEGHGSHGHAPVLSKLPIPPKVSNAVSKVKGVLPTVKTTAATTTKESFTSVISNIYKTRGIGGFYVGLEARLAHVAAIITSQLMLYDVIKVALGLPVTGSH